MIKTTINRILGALVLALLVGFILGSVPGFVIGKMAGSGKAAQASVVSAVQVTDQDPVEEPQQYEEDKPHFESLGTFTVTAYCSCSKCCGKSDGITATGAKAKAGTTVAVDPSFIPYGSTILIDGVAYIAQDTMAQNIRDKYDGKVVDIYFESHDAAVAYGRQNHEVYILLD